MPKIIVSTNMKGGVGKTTVSINLAHAFKGHARTAIIDLDSQGSLSDVAECMEGVQVIPYSNNLKSLPYDFIIIDTPPYVSSKLAESYAIADLILIPIRASVLDFKAASRTVSMVMTAMSKNPRLKAAFVLNLVKAGTKITKAANHALGEYNFTIFGGRVGDRTDFARSVALGDGIYSNELRKTSALARMELSGLATEVLCLLQDRVPAQLGSKETLHLGN